jgi:hypothetical protein
MPLALAPPAFAAAFVFIGSLVYDPQILTLRWPDGHEERVAAISPDTCESAVRAVERGLWPKDDPPPTSASCAPGNRFAVGSDCIEKYNCGKGR